MRTLSILLTNYSLNTPGGSETWVRDVALALLRRGHRPVAFSRAPGPVADDLRRATVPVIDDIGTLGEPPDLIHGHHPFETLIAALAFPSVPIVQLCHGWPPDETPLRHPSIRRYVAVDNEWRDRLVREGVPPARVELLMNFVDLGLEAAVDQLVTIYARAVDDPPGDGDPLAATLAYLRQMAVPIAESAAIAGRVGTLSGELTLARAERDALARAGREALESARADRERIRAERDSLRTLLDSARVREHALAQQLDAFRSLPTLRVRDALLRIPLVGPVVRTTARQLSKLLL